MNIFTPIQKNLNLNLSAHKLDGDIPDKKNEEWDVLNTISTCDKSSYEIIKIM